MRKPLLALIPLLLCLSGAARPAEDEVARGRYLATLGDCAICHTAPGRPDRPYAGGYPLHAYFGTVYSSNITPDPATGIGRWSPDEFYRAMHEGIAAGGRHLYPAFPYSYFTKLSRADSDALYAYLRTLRPIAYRPPPNRLIFPTDIRFGMTFWNWLFLDTAPLAAVASQSPAWNRGKALVDGIGHCGGCHTGKTFFFSDKADRYLAGETIDGWYAPNLTGAKRTGLGAWTAADIATYLKLGANRFGRAVGAMQDVIRLSTSRMSDRDRSAIAAYLKSLPPAPEPRARKPDAASMALGQSVFVARCAVCHGTDTQSYPALGGNTLVQQTAPATLVRIILQGSQSVPVAGQKRRYSMPAFPVLSNVELAAVATYVRNSWGNAAGPVSAGEVAQLRRLLRPGD